MSEFPRFCVSNWASSIQVVDGNNVAIGSIKLNDFFRWERVTYYEFKIPPKTYYVRIRNNAGIWQAGQIRGQVQDEPALFRPVVAVGLASFTWNGLSLRRFTIQNFSVHLRRMDNSQIAILPVGTAIAANAVLSESVMGATQTTLWRIAAVLRAPAGGGNPVWTWANPDAGATGANRYAFVDTGLPANRPTTIAIRTSLA